MARDRTHPFRGFLDVFSEMERMRRLGRTGAPDDGADRSSERSEAWVPVADIVAVGEDLVIRLEVPGVDPAAVDLTFAGGVLTISGERSDDLGADAQPYVRERRHGSFRRSMILPDDVRETAITASYRVGVLDVRVAGAARAGQASRIPIEDRSGGSAAPVPAHGPRGGGIG